MRGVMETDTRVKWHRGGRNRENVLDATLKQHASFPHRSIIGMFLADVCPTEPPGKVSPKLSRAIKASSQLPLQVDNQAILTLDHFNNQLNLI